MVASPLHRVRQQLHLIELCEIAERARACGGRVLGRALGRILEGTPIWEREWDVLCLLDGCRHDLLRAAARGGHPLLPPPGEVEAIWSVGSQSAEWMDRTFAPRFREEMADTAYVTGNPFSAQPCDHLPSVTGEAMPLARDQFGLLYEAWRDRWEHGAISTIPPRPLTDAAIGAWRAREELDIDRVVVHYMQPHAPFRSRPDWFLGEPDLEGWGRVGGGDSPEDLADLDLAEWDGLEAFAEDDSVKDPWTRLRDGELPRKEFWAAYRDNLEWVLDSVAVLAENCGATVALTSDHGNAAGEWGVWSHPPGVAVPALRRVPWVGVDSRDTRSRRPGPPAPARDGPVEPGDAVSRRLGDLGYR